MFNRLTTKRTIHSKGFTLVELLVVIAIIGILASIVIPNVSGFIRKGNVTKAVAEVQGIETALTAMLSDVNRSDFRNWFKQDSGSEIDLTARIDAYEVLMTPATFNQDAAVVATTNLSEFYTEMFYQLIRQGKNAEIAIDLKPEIRQKLGNTYSDLGLDPWKQKYRFWIGPMRGKYQIFRSYRIPTQFTADLEEMDLTNADPNLHPYKYNDAAHDKENSRIPGAPKPDYDDPKNIGAGSLILAGGVPQNAFYGFPAPKDQPMYVYSLGPNQLDDANAIIQKNFAPDDYPFWGGGDDINNWDNERGWDNAPK